MPDRFHCRGLNKRIPDTLLVGTLHHAVWGSGQLITQQGVNPLGRYCNWEVDFEYFDSNGASYHYDSGPLYQSCDARGGRTITSNYDESAEHVNRNGAHGRYFKTGYTCPHLVDGPTRRITPCTDIFPG